MRESFFLHNPERAYLTKLQNSTKNRYKMLVCFDRWVNRNKKLQEVCF